MQNLQKSRVASFPAEVLCEIFAELQFKGRLYTSHTCRHWRASSLSSRAKLWTCIASYGLVPGALLAQLERAQPLPVSVYVSFHGRTPGIVRETARAIDKHLFHTRLLVVDGSSSVADLSRADVVKIFKSFRSPAPMLEEFELAIWCDVPDMDEDETSEDAMSGTSEAGSGNDQLQGVTIASRHEPIERERLCGCSYWFFAPSHFHLFAGQAPRLRRVFISGDVEISRPRCAAFAGVRQLSWQPTDNVYEYDIEAIERSFPLLERLEIEYGAWSPDDGEGYDDKRVSPLRLQRLYLTVEAKVANASPIWLLWHLQFEHIPDVRCFFDDYIDGWFPAFFVGGDHTDYKLHVTTHTGDDYASWTVEDLGVRGHGRRRILVMGNVPPPASDDWEPPAPALWGNLVRLELDERFLKDFLQGHLAPLPRVTQLQRIYCVPLTSDSGDNALSILTLPWTVPDLRPIPCPQLRSLELLPTGGRRRLEGSDSAPVVLAPEDICNFLRLCLACDAPKLDELVMWSAELLTLPLGPLWLLIDSVENLWVHADSKLHLASGDHDDHVRGFSLSNADGWDPDSFFFK